MSFLDKKFIPIYESLDGERTEDIAKRNDESGKRAQMAPHVPLPVRFLVAQGRNGRWNV